MVVIGGGELFASNMNFNSAFFSWIKVLNKHKIPVFVYGVSGNKVNKLYALRNKYALKKCEFISVRDEKSKNLFYYSYGIKVEKYPDVVFSFIEKKVKKEHKFYSILCNPLSFNYYNQITNKNIELNKYYVEWCKIIKKNCRQHTKVYIGTTTKEDEITAVSFFEFIRKQYPEWNAELHITDELGKYCELVQKMDCVISARMHALILAVQNGCLSVPVCFKEKISEFDKEYGDYLVLKKPIKDVSKFAKLGLTILSIKISEYINK